MAAMLSRGCLRKRGHLWMPEGEGTPQEARACTSADWASPRSRNCSCSCAARCVRA